jgi:hypothetical protein
VVLDEAYSGKYALSYSLEKIRAGSLFFHLSQRLPYKLYGMVEDNPEKAFLAAEILKKRSLGYADLFYHAIDARLPEPMACELIHGCVQDFAPFCFIKLVESIARKHGSPRIAENDYMVISIINAGNAMSN